MTTDERRELLRIAREAIAAVLEGRDAEPRGATPAARAPGAAFVSLHHQGELRGCIGRIEPGGRLADVIAECAVSAATRDPRFSQLTARELAHGTEIEVSVLTPMQPVASPDEIEIGRDGLLVRQGAHSGLLLPQVASEWGWDRETFLAQTCRKAGLPLDAWKRGATVSRFQAEIFSESDERPPQSPEHPQD